MRFSRLAQRKRGGVLQEPAPTGRLCEYVDAGGGIALARVQAVAREAELIVSARGSELAFSPVSGEIADGPQSLAFAGPLYMIAEPDVRVVLRGPRGDERVAVKPVDRTCDPAGALDADSVSELAALRIRC